MKTEATPSEYATTSHQLKPITPFMDEVIDEVLQDNNRLTPLVKQFNICITFHDIESLLGLNWLNDQIINFYIAMIVRRSNQEEFPDSSPHYFTKNY